MDHFLLTLIGPPMHHIAELPRCVFAKAEAQLIGLAWREHGPNLVAFKVPKKHTKIGFCTKISGTLMNELQKSVMYKMPCSAVVLGIPCVLLPSLR